MQLVKARFVENPQEGFSSTSLRLLLLTCGFRFMQRCGRPYPKLERLSLLRQKAVYRNETENGNRHSGFRKQGPT